MNNAEWEAINRLSEEDKAKISGGNAIDKSTELSETQCKKLKKLVTTDKPIEPYFHVMMYGCHQPINPFDENFDKNKVPKNIIDNTEITE